MAQIAQKTKKMTKGVRLALIVVLSLVAVTAVEVAWQYNYPAAHAAVNFTLNDKIVRVSQAEAEDILSELYESKTIVLVNDKAEEFETNLADIGAKVDSTKQIEALFDYPTWQRWVPYSYFLNFFNSGPISVPDFELPSLQLAAFPVQEAQILNEEGQLRVEAALDGLNFDAAKLQSQLQTLELDTTERQLIPSQFTIPRPLITTAAAEDMLDKVLLNSAQGVTLGYNGQSATVPQVDLLRWLSFNSNVESQTIELSLYEDELRNFVTNSSLEAPVTTVRNTVINYTDGVETSRTTGRSGITVDYEALIAGIRSTLLDGPLEAPLDISVIERKPSTEYVDTYTNEFIRKSVEERLSAFGGTFVDVNLSTQHLIYVKDAHIIFDSAIVTGRPSMPTPAGTYHLLNKARHVTLVGEDYRTPVSYWMAFIGSSYGLHDATWQSSFGGSRWKSGFGSHGCVNMPLWAAAELYGLISVGDVVYVHW